MFFADLHGLTGNPPEPFAFGVCGMEMKSPGRAIGPRWAGPAEKTEEELVDPIDGEVRPIRCYRPTGALRVRSVDGSLVRLPSGPESERGRRRQKRPAHHVRLRRLQRADQS